MKKRIPGFLSLGILGISYWLIRYPLFSLHGMKEFPLILFCTAGVIIAISGIGLRHKVVPLCISAAYPVGFVLGYLFETDGPHETNNFWVIWLCTFAAALLAGIGMGLIGKARARKQLRDSV